MPLPIESRVHSGELKGETQPPWRDRQGFFIASSERFEKNYIRVVDLDSLANALVAGLKVRMKAERQTAAGLVKPESITINGLSVSDWHYSRTLKESDR